MTRLPDESISFQNTVGDSGIENLYVYGKLNYDFKNDDITVKSINVRENSVFTGDISLDEITCRNANVTGIATVGTGLYLNGKLYDGDGDFGTSGQLLSSDGTDTVWIDANTTSVANSINVGTNLNSTNADQFVTFVGSSSGNNPIRVDTDLKYNPSTNRLTAGSFAGDGSALTGVDSFVTGMIIMWNSTVASIPTGFVLCDGNNGTPDLRGRFVVGHHPSNGDYDVDDTGGAEDVTLTIAQMPSHKHDTSVDNTRLFPSNGQTSINFGGAGGYPATTFTMSNTGGGQSHENRPPYYALCYIMKT
jgi:microcystin-dependent protein